MPARFCGRSEDLAHLQALWQEVATGSGPQVVVLLGDSQVGKTRLVQEFYGWLAREHRSDDAQGYWPLSLTEAERNLLINPPLEDVDETQNPPFMWWGVRVSDPGNRNSAGTGAIWRALSYLDAHLAPLQRAQRHKRYWLDQMRSAAPTLIKHIPIVGPGFELAGPVIEFIRRDIERQRHEVARALDDEERALRVELNERIVNKLGLLMRPREDAAPIPLVWVLDDAHFSPGDPGVTELLERMLREADVVGWPLLTVVTHWAQPWHEELEGDGPPGIAQRLQALKDDFFLPDLEPVDLGPLAPVALGSMLDERLPGLSPEQRARLLERADGLPGFLDELTSFCIEEPYLFVDNDPTQPLEPDGLEEVNCPGYCRGSALPGLLDRATRIAYAGTSQLMAHAHSEFRLRVRTPGGKHGSLAP